MTRRPPELPNIEDATLLACLAPLMEAMHARVEPAVAALAIDLSAERSAKPRLAPAGSPAGSNDNPAPGDRPSVDTPGTRAEWRSLADDDFGAFRTIELFLAMTDAELETAAAEFPRQIGGTIARIGRIKRRLSKQYDTVTTVTALLERAVARAAAARV